MSTITTGTAIEMFVADAAAAGGRRPLIGLTAGTSTLTGGAWAGSEATVLNRSYTDAIHAAGGRAIILTPGEEWSAEEVADLDALVLTGGTDLSPALYGKAPLATDFAPSSERDAFEIALVRAAIDLRLPVLGICRGLQIINVARGGSLVQHLGDQAREAGYPDTATALTSVGVSIAADSDLALDLGTGADVAAFHHQAVDRLGEGLRVIARHSSGVVHAVQSASADVGDVIGLQFHPEVTEGAEPVFATLVASARQRAACTTMVGDGARARA
ncbi:MAG: gamma-glutamyl-gamma-aminobutyrate hydrolase family protein [Dermabacter sp.]|nr:gamma-glutamyl-gamma-aminobutyrate hydrolase family protein [Dermabacter sp.]